MGVDFSTSVGYGLAVADDEASEYLKAFEPHEDGQIPEIMDTCGWNLIDYDYCGDWMSGPQVYFFYIKGTENLHFEAAYADSIITEFGESPVISTDALVQLNEIAEHFGIEGRIGWKMIANVS